MSQSPRHLLETLVLVGGSRAEAARAQDALEGLVGSVLVAEDAAGAEALVRSSGAELAVVREEVPPDQALGLVGRLCQAAPGCRVVVVGGGESVRRAVEFVKAGAQDYLSGPLDAAGLRSLVEQQAAEISRADSGREKFFCPQCPPEVPIVGRSPAVLGMLETLRLVAESRCDPILVLGETGTGKEMAARAVHAWRCGPGEPFVAVNCAALTASLLESELFGHVRGAFTGAERDKTGLFELAGAGTLFLDEITEIPLELQAKLLRVLQERVFRKVGGTKDLRCKATIVATSNRPILEEVAAGRFRKDLYYRLAVFPVRLAPLRAEGRRGDIPLLAEYFIETSTVRPRGGVKGLTPGAVEKLLAHDWPGNVRELRNVMDRALILEQSDRISPGSILLDVMEAAPPAKPSPTPQPARGQDPPAAEDFSLKTAERELIIRALKQTGWQRTRAAALLGITRATLHSKLKRYGIRPPGDSDVPTGGSGRRCLEAAGV